MRRRLKRPLPLSTAVSKGRLLLTVDWMLDRMRTTLNVWGDSVGAAVIEQLEASPSS